MNKTRTAGHYFFLIKKGIRNVKVCFHFFVPKKYPSFPSRFFIPIALSVAQVSGFKTIPLTALFIVFLIPSLIYPQDPKNIIQKTGKAVEQAGKKTVQTVNDVAKTLTEPIRDPKAAMSRWFDFDPRLETGERTNFNVLPLFVSSPERGVGFGIKFAQESLLKKQDLIGLQIVQTLKGKSSYRLNYSLPPHFFKQLELEISMGYENYERFYYGVGNQSNQENESMYNPEYFDVKIPILYKITNLFSMGIFINFENWKIVGTEKTGALQKDFSKLIGTDSSRLYTSGYLMRWDSRNSKTDPSKGFFIEGALEYSKKLLGSETDFTRTTLESRYFYPLSNNDHHVFAFRTFMDYKSKDVPFYKLPELGGIFFNRGLIEGRFRDTLSFTGNWEYRLKIYHRLHWAFFVDAGNVYEEFHAIHIAHTKITGGTGMRYYVPPGNLLLARIDGGYSSEGFLLYLTFDQPF